MYHYTAIIKQHDGQFVGYVQEKPAALAQAASEDDLVKKLRLALAKVLDFEARTAEIKKLSI